MTQPAAQHPQVYIITEQQLEELWTQCESRYFDEMRDNIRSRPIPPSQTPCEGCRFVSPEYFRPTGCVGVCAVMPERLKEHNTAIRDKALDDLVSELKEYLEFCADGAFRGLPLTSEVEAISPAQFMEWIRSLREREK